MAPHKKSIRLGEHTLTLEHGEIGRQANATVMVEMGETVVMCAVTASPSVRPGADFLPLTVDYQEKTYAAGRFPGGFFRRESKPPEKDVLTSRLIDRSLRPLFPKTFFHEMNLLCTVVSFNPEIDSDIPAMIGGAAAVAVAGLPFGGPIAACRIGHVDGQFVTNPTRTQMAESKLDLVVAGTRRGVVMVESEAQILPEETMLEAVMTGHREIQPVIDAIEELAREAGRPKWEWSDPELDPGRLERLRGLAGERIQVAYGMVEKQPRQQELARIKEEVAAEMAGDEGADDADANLVKGALKKIEAGVVRERILRGEPRIDGRTTRTVRPISVRTGLLPRAHGSALFTRGETQALVSCTLGVARDEQRIDSLYGEYYDRFLVHYNMPPFATGETGRTGPPKRREVGHGRLAKRGLAAVVPDLEGFGHPVRLVSEITESNGSSSMASVCGGSLALMDAGVPVSADVAGIAMGLIQQDDRFAVLSDILGDEDHLGDMDFKVAGTEDGITALQMDIKIDSIGRPIMAAALEQAREGRLHILGEMRKALSKPRESVSAHAPSVLKMKIGVDKIRDVIGKGGVTIRGITESTGANVDVEDDGSVTVSGPTLAICQAAEEMIKAITTELELGKIYEGKVTKILDFGAIVSILPNSEGLLHISQIANERVEKVTDHLSEGQTIRVKVIKMDDKGRIRLSMKETVEGEAGPGAAFSPPAIELEVGKTYDGKVAKILDIGAIVSIPPGADGLVHISQIAHERIEKVSDHLSEGQEIRVKVIKIDDSGRVRLSMKEADSEAEAAEAATS